MTINKENFEEFKGNNNFISLKDDSKNYITLYNKKLDKQILL